MRCYRRMVARNERRWNAWVDDRFPRIRTLICRRRGHRWMPETEEAGGAFYIVGHYCERCWRYERIR